MLIGKVHQVNGKTRVNSVLDLLSRRAKSVRKLLKVTFYDALNIFALYMCKQKQLHCNEIFAQNKPRLLSKLPASFLLAILNPHLFDYRIFFKFLFNFIKAIIRIQCV